MELTFSHKNIKTTLKSRTVHTKHLLNACGRSRTCEKMRKPPHNQVGPQEKRKRESEWSLHPREGSSEAQVSEVRPRRGPGLARLWKTRLKTHKDC